MGRNGVRRMLVALGAALSMGVLAAPVQATVVSPQETLTYIPYGFIHWERSAQFVQETLGHLQEYGIGQNLLPLPKLKKTGILKLSRKELRTLPLWASQTAAYNAAHGTSIVATASFAGKVKGKSLNLEEPAVRANMIAGIETVLSLGVGGISLDLEPYPTSHGYVLLLEEIDALFARRGFTGRLSITTPASAGRWAPQFMEEVTPLVDQVDPLFYDSERKTAASYEQWVREGLAYYSANTAPSTRIVPDLPSYGANKWHDPAVENLATATTAVEEALAEGSRVNGAGIFWWWGFYYDEEEEGEYEGAPDRATWLSRSLAVPFTP
jgi:hypothetical protein